LVKHDGIVVNMKIIFIKINDTLLGYTRIHMYILYNNNHHHNHSHCS
jgi:hypothetical protein